MSKESVFSVGNLSAGGVSVGGSVSGDTPGAMKGKCLTWVRGEELGCGSLGRVFSAMNLSTGQLIAVKEVAIEESLESDLSFKLALEKEVEILQCLKHPHIVSYLGHDTIDGCLYIYLEHMPGGSLASVLAQFGAFEESLAAVYTRELLEGLEYLHSRSPPVVHRDVKGANILVGLDCKVKLSDFGCSKRSMETLSRTIRGSIPWMAPEVITHNGYGRSADVWSFGCVVIEMLTASRPWGRFDNAMAAMVRIGMSEETPPLPSGASARCLDFIESCLRREPVLRLSALELLAHPFVAPLDAGAPERRSTQEFIESAPDYGSLGELLPEYLE